MSTEQLPVVSQGFQSSYDEPVLQTSRADDAVMLALAEGKVKWYFYPPGSTVNRQGRGIWSISRSATDGEIDKDLSMRAIL